MADDLKDTIRQNAQGPAKAAGDAGSRREDDEGIAIEQLESLLRSRLNGRVCDLRVVEN